MACGSGCCAPPGDSDDKPDTRKTEQVHAVAHDSHLGTDKAADMALVNDECGDSCCASDADDEPLDCCGGGSTNDRNIVKDSCCSSDTDKGAGCCTVIKDTSKDVDSCCALSKSTQKDTDKETGCCTSNSTKNVDDRPGCCEGKTTPCCDDACIDRIALRACRSSDAAHDSASASTCASRQGIPCSEHRRKTRSQYGARLAALGCICRALAALGQESCCLPASKGKGRETREKQQSATAASAAAHRRSLDSCCGAGGCSDAPKTTCAGRDEKQPDADLEKASLNEHVVLSISGMTCTGCETKLLRTLGAHPAVANLKTSLVLARAEFDLIGHGHAVDSVVKHVERTTEFTCEQITNNGGGASLDIRVPHTAAAAGLDHENWPDGVLDVTVVDKQTVHVAFDPKIIGARAVLRGGWLTDGDLQLAPQRLDPALAAGSRHVRHTGYMTLAAIVLTIPVLVMAWAPLPDRPVAYGSASLALATAVQVAIAGPFYPRALKALVFARVIEMDLLVVLSTTTAYVFSVVSFAYAVVGKPLPTGSFFETSTLLVTLIMLGRWVAALARQKAVESISIRSLQAPTAVIRSSSKEEETIDARLLQYGDVFQVMPDSTVPTDGTVIEGTSHANEAMLTGEARPVAKQPGSKLIAGSINGAGTLYARVTRLPGENTISAIAAMVDEAKLSKPRIQALADRVASCFVPAIAALTIATFCVWVAVGMRVRHQTARDAAIQAVTYAITVLIVSCPCAVGLAVPMVVVIASGAAAERGVIFKSAEAIEVMHKVEHVVLDKTGTVTQGRLTVSRAWHVQGEGAAATASLGLLCGLLDGIKHPVAQSVVAHLTSQGIASAPVHDKKALPGKGVEGVEGISEKLGQAKLQAGNSRWLGLGEHAVVASMLAQGLTTFCFVVDGQAAAVFGLADTLRPDAAATVARLAASGVAVHLVSGDDDGAVQTAAQQLGIAAANVRARCSPADKREYVQRLAGAATQEARETVVVFVGDGTNDAAALAQATVGVHVDSEGGTDVAQAAADVVLVRPDLSGLLVARAVSRTAVRRIVFNFGWSFVYNLAAILLAAGVFEAVSERDVRIPPEYAGLGELVSVLPVVVAATLLRWAKYDE